MIIKQLYLKNFRGYSEITIPFDESFNLIIGKNDIGKSSILEALEIFFNSQIVSMEINDINVNHTDNEVVIGVTLDADPDMEIVLDETHTTTLRKESLLNADGCLEIRKVWDFSGKTLTSKSLSTYLYANYFGDYHSKPLLLQKMAELKKMCKDAGLYERVSDARVCADYREVLHDALQNKEKKMTMIRLDSEDAKKVYEKINSTLPYFALFMSDRPNHDSDKEVQDPLKVITKQAIAEVQDQLDAVVNEIQAKAMEKGRRTIEKLNDMNQDIAKELTPSVTHKNWDSLFSFSFIGDNGIPMNKRGSGVRRLIILNYFRAEAEDKGGTNGVIYAIEEPETSQHPDYQRMLIESLMKLSKQANRQIIITTHSPEFAKIASNENIVFLKKDEQGVPKVEDTAGYKIMAIKEDMGVLPSFSKLVICVEGPNDVNFLSNINQNVPELKAIIDLKKENISIIPLGGSNLETWVNKNYLGGSNIREFHLYDKDSNSGRNTEQYKKYVGIVNKRDGCFATMTQKRELENYIDRSIYETMFNKDLSSISNWDEENIPPHFITDKLLETKVKQKINGCLSQYMTKELFERNNSWDEVKGWFEKIKEMYEE